jgi:hypothetical protein
MEHHTVLANLGWGEFIQAFIIFLGTFLGAHHGVKSGKAD